jgi:AcrR family transcriptional regulator
MRKTKEDTDKTVEQILNSALEIFNRNGFHATKLDDVASHAGMTRGPISWHFKNKANLHKAVLERCAENFGSGVDIAFGKQFTSIERINNFVDLIFSDSKTLHKEINLINRLMASSEEQSHIKELKVPIEETIYFLFDKLKDTIKEGLDAKTFKSSLDVNFLSKTIYAYGWGLMGYPIVNFEDTVSSEEIIKVKYAISQILGCNQ